MLAKETDWQILGISFSDESYRYRHWYFYQSGQGWEQKIGLDKERKVLHELCLVKRES